MSLFCARGLEIRYIQTSLQQRASSDSVLSCVANNVGVKMKICIFFVFTFAISVVPQEDGNSTFVHLTFGPIVDNNETTSLKKGKWEGQSLPKNICFLTMECTLPVKITVVLKGSWNLIHWMVGFELSNVENCNVIYCIP